MSVQTVVPDDIIPFRIGRGLESGNERLLPSLQGGYLGVRDGSVSIYFHHKLTGRRKKVPAESVPIDDVLLNICELHGRCLHQTGLRSLPRPHFFFKQRDWGVARQLAALTGG